MRHVPSFILPALAVVPFCACSVASITGEVDGDVVPAFQSGLVYQADALTPDDDFVAVAAFYSFSDACNAVADQLDTKADSIRGLGEGKDVERLINDVSSYEEDNFPEDYWAAYVVLTGKNEAAIEDDFDLEKDNAGVLVCHHKGAVDAPRDEPGAALLPDYLAPFLKDSNRDCFQAEKGDVRVSLYDRKSISLIAKVSLVDDQDDDAGRVELGGLAAQCEKTEKAADGLLSEVQDLQTAQSAPPPAASANDSCQFAFDGECDEPGVGTGACDAGTDATDCG